MCHENENKGFTDDWAVFDTMVVASRDKEW